jgi:Lrp/AsnC family transcriptional regulator for asnA, asnC and gidA
MGDVLRFTLGQQITLWVNRYTVHGHYVDGATAPVVSMRIQRLPNERVLNVGAVTHPGTHGYTRSAMVCISVDHRVDAVSTALAYFDQIYYIVTTNGRYDLLAEVMAEDDRDLQNLVMDIRALPGVVSTETIPFVDTVKWVYRPGFKEDRQNGQIPRAARQSTDSLNVPATEH